MAGPDRAPDSGRSWLLIKHRDEWSGDLDIAEFAPLSVKSGEDFPEILAEDVPAVWISHRPVEGGETGAMLADVIQKAARLKAERLGEQKQPKAHAAKPRSKSVRSLHEDPILAAMAAVMFTVAVPTAEARESASPGTAADSGEA